MILRNKIDMITYEYTSNDCIISYYSSMEYYSSWDWDDTDTKEERTIDAASSFIIFKLVSTKTIYQLMIKFGW